ncbi:hypothetical protein N9239_00460 [bacterium]|nr:hypothetical protein [bacterium]
MAVSASTELIVVVLCLARGQQRGILFSGDQEQHRRQFLQMLRMHVE